ncbi:MAG: cupin domain-containing protein [Roseovarius sp.]
MTQHANSSLLSKLDVSRLKEIEAVSADPAVLLDGAPTFRTSVQESIDSGMVETGVWEATPGMTRSVKGGKTEFCYIISGRVEITQEGAEPQVFGPGDAFVMKPGFIGTWRTLEAVRKFFVIVDPSQIAPVARQ